MKEGQGKGVPHCGYAWQREHRPPELAPPFSPSLKEPRPDHLSRRPHRGYGPQDGVQRRGQCGSREEEEGHVHRTGSHVITRLACVGAEGSGGGLRGRGCIHTVQCEHIQGLNTNSSPGFYHWVLSGTPSPLPPTPFIPRRASCGLIACACPAARCSTPSPRWRLMAPSAAPSPSPGTDSLRCVGEGGAS